MHLSVCIYVLEAKFRNAEFRSSPRTSALINREAPPPVDSENLTCRRTP